jgi:hypothetical protein
MSTAKPGCLAPFLRLFGINRSAQIDDTPAGEPLPYRVSDNFLSPAELSFYRVLSLAIGQDAVICPQAGLGAIFFVPKGSERFYGHWNRIAAKRIDFLLCDPTTMRPLAGIELDDASHKAESRQERDAFVADVFEAASLPLIRLPDRVAYAPADLASQIKPLLAPVPATGQVPAVEETSTPEAVPICPKCGIPMVMRTSRRGDRAGQLFWGCSNYPRYREMQSV